MKTNFFCCTAALLFALCVVSCSKDDENTSPTGQTVDPNKHVPDPVGTTTINMRNDDNGRTYLDNIYIDDANNFVSSSYYRFVDLGAMRGLGNITTLVWDGLSSQCAVVPGHGYCAYYGLREFSSGKLAMGSGGKVYKIYVDSWILSGASTILGAVVKYVTPTLERYGLQEYGTTIGTVLPVAGQSFSIDLADKVAAFPDSDFEFEGYLVDDGYSHFTVSRSGKTLTFTLVTPIPVTPQSNRYYCPGRIRIRVKGFYTEVAIAVMYPEY